MFIPPSLYIRSIFLKVVEESPSRKMQLIFFCSLPYLQSFSSYSTKCVFGVWIFLPLLTPLRWTLVAKEKYVCLILFACPMWFKSSFGLLVNILWVIVSNLRWFLRTVNQEVIVRWGIPFLYIFEPTCMDYKIFWKKFYHKDIYISNPNKSC